MTLYLGLAFHIYQPPTQKPSTLRGIIKESYLPLFKLLLKYDFAKLTLNINGSLLELLEFYQEEDLLNTIKMLTQRKQIDLLGSSCYHAILPLIPVEEIIRQVKLNEELHKKVLGENIEISHGFWLPEMAYDSRIIEPLFSLNYNWTIISSVATPTIDLPDNYLPKVNGDFIIYFRNDLLSNFISFKHPNVEEFCGELIATKDPCKEDYYIILAMDGETYGHHIKGLIEDFLEPLFIKLNANPNIKLVKIAELPTIFTQKKDIIAKSSSWSTTEEDLQQGIPFPLWSDPKNPIHKLQLSIMNYTLYLVTQAQSNLKGKHCKKEETIKKFEDARRWLDQGLHSCQLWWASKRPWYSSEMILKGLNQLIIASSEALKVILEMSEVEDEKNKALKVFDEIFVAQKEIYLSV